MSALQLQPYTRPNLTEEGKGELRKAAFKLAMHGNGKVRATYIFKAFEENARLLLEVNDHRAARGFEPLDVHEVTE